MPSAPHPTAAIPQAFPPALYVPRAAPPRAARQPRHATHRTVVLRDGTRMLLRPLRPSDRAMYLRGFEHLSPQTRYMRFFSPKSRLTDAEIHYFVDVDHHDHEAIAAIDLSTGEGIAVARYVRDCNHPGSAEISITIADAYQGRGLGAHLLEAVAERAAEEGLQRLRASVLADNHRMLTLIRRRWPHHVVRRAPASVLELEFDLAPAPAAAAHTG